MPGPLMIPQKVPIREVTSSVPDATGIWEGVNELSDPFYHRMRKHDNNTPAVSPATMTWPIKRSIGNGISVLEGVNASPENPKDGSDADSGGHYH